MSPSKTRWCNFLLAGGAALMLAGGLVGTAWGDEAAPAKAATPPFHHYNFDLLPLNELERQEFMRENRALVTRLQALGKQLGKLNKNLSGRKNKNDDASKKLKANMTKAREKLKPLLTEVVEKVRKYGVDDRLLAYLAKAPGGRGREGRYARSLVFLLEDLTPKQRALFERILPQMEGASVALRAQKERMRLALKQADVDWDVLNGLLKTFDRQSYQNERRFWRLVDCVLTTDQKARLHRLLPFRYQRRDNVIEHIYALPDMEPAQTVRVKALLTEVEAESSPDNAALRRIRVALKQKDLPRDERRALRREMNETNERLQTLQRFSVDALKEILSEEQWLALEAIPPRVSANDRRENVKRTFEGLEMGPGQKERMKKLASEFRARKRKLDSELREVRRQASDYGPDSPQQMMMQSMMGSVAGRTQAAQREMLGQVFMDILRPDQVSGWLLGLYGRKR